MARTSLKMNFVFLHYSNHFVQIMQIFQFNYHNLPRILSDISIRKSLCVCVCMCVCVCVCMCVHACMYVYVCKNQVNSKQCFNCHMNNTISRIYLPDAAKFQRVRKLKIKTICHVYMTQIFTCLKFCYISSLIKKYILKQSHQNAIL